MYYGQGGVIISWFTSSLAGLAVHNAYTIISMQFSAISGFVWNVTGFGLWTNPVPLIHC